MNTTEMPVLFERRSRPAGVRSAPTEALAATLGSRRRRLCWRTVRLCAAGALVLAIALLGGKTLTTVESEQAYLNAPITTLRAPICGQLQLEQLEPGTLLPSGTPLFRVENPRFGNLEAMSQLNWLQELVDRLRVESAEAEIRRTKQEQIFDHHENLFNEKLISRLEYLEEETKVLLCQAAATQKNEQLRAAEARKHEVEQQLALQKQAVVVMPFDGVVWAVRVQDGSQVAAHDSVLHVIDPKRIWVDAFLHEKRADKFQVGAPVVVCAVDGKEAWHGSVESIRAGVGRIDHESLVAAPPGDLSRRRIAARVKLESPHPFTARQFFGVGRSVVVSLSGDE